MPSYRLYSVDADGHILRATYIDCATDADALTAAQAVMGEYAVIEVWQGRRFVGRVGRPPPFARPWLCLEGIRHQTRAMIADPCLSTLAVTGSCPCSSPDCSRRQVLLEQGEGQ
jgi:hypothetical protein